MKKQLIYFNQESFTRSEAENREKEALFNALLEEALKFINVADKWEFEKNPQGYLEREYLNKFPALKDSEVTFRGLISMQQKDLSKFENALKQYIQAPGSIYTKPQKEQFEIYAETKGQTELFNDLENLIKQANSLKLKHGINVHLGLLFQVVPGAFRGFGVPEVNHNFILSYKR